MTSKNYIYAITLSKTRFPNVVSYYDEFIGYVNEQLDCRVEYHYESEKGLHLHLIAYSSKRLYVNNIREYLGKYGYSIDFKEIESADDERVWLAYIRKDCHLERDYYQEQKEQEKQFLSYIEYLQEVEGYNKKSAFKRAKDQGMCV